MSDWGGHDDAPFFFFFVQPTTIRKAQRCEVGARAVPDQDDVVAIPSVPRDVVASPAHGSCRQYAGTKNKKLLTYQVLIFFRLALLKIFIIGVGKDPTPMIQLYSIYIKNAFNTTKLTGNVPDLLRVLNPRRQPIGHDDPDQALGGERTTHISVELVGNGGVTPIPSLPGPISHSWKGWEFSFSPSS